MSLHCLEYFPPPPFRMLPGSMTFGITPKAKVTWAMKKTWLSQLQSIPIFYPRLSHPIPTASTNLWKTKVPRDTRSVRWGRQRSTKPVGAPGRMRAPMMDGDVMTTGIWISTLISIALANETVNDHKLCWCRRYVIIMVVVVVTVMMLVVIMMILNTVGFVMIMVIL